MLVEGVGVRGVVAWTCVRAEGQETEDGVWPGGGGYERHFDGVTVVLLSDRGWTCCIPTQVSL